MAAKAILILCAQAVLAQVAFGACLNAAPCGLGGAYGLAGYGGYGINGLGAGCGVASTGGGLPVASASPNAPVGVSVLSENCYEGSLAVGGNLPFLGTVALEGVLPTAGAGAVNYGCGNGAVGIGSEGPIATGILTGNNFAPAIDAIGYGINGYGLNGLNGLNGYGYGLNGYGAGIYGLGNGCGCGCGNILY